MAVKCGLHAEKLASPAQWSTFASEGTMFAAVKRCFADVENAFAVVERWFDALGTKPLARKTMFVGPRTMFAAL